jgi:hypothetical protein
VRGAFSDDRPYRVSRTSNGNLGLDLGMTKSILLGLGAVLVTATLAIIAEIIAFFAGQPPAATGSPNSEVGIDLVVLAKEKLFTPTGHMAGAVIFTLTILVSTRRGTQQSGL